MLNRLIGNVPIKINDPKTFWLDVNIQNRVIVDNNRTPKIDCLQEGVTESLNIRRIGYQIRVGVDIRECINLLSINYPPLLPNDVRYEVHWNAH